jgi:hypothetical protein
MIEVSSLKDPTEEMSPFLYLKTEVIEVIRHPTERVFPSHH